MLGVSTDATETIDKNSRAGAANTERNDFEPLFGDAGESLRRNWRFFGLLAVMLSVAAVFVALLVPISNEYERRVALTTDLAPSDFLLSIERASRFLPSRDLLSKTATAALRDADFKEVEVVNSTYDSNTLQLGAVLRSRDKDALSDATSEAISHLEAELGRTYERNFRDALELELQRAKRDVQIRRDAAGLAEAEFRQEELRRELEDVSRFTAEAVSVEVVDESDVRELGTSSKRAGLIVFAVMGGLVAAATLTVFRERLKAIQRK